MLGIAATYCFRKPIRSHSIQNGSARPGLEPAQLRDNYVIARTTRTNNIKQ